MNLILWRIGCLQLAQGLSKVPPKWTLPGTLGTVGGAGLGSKAASPAVEGAGSAGNAARAGAVAGDRLWEGRPGEGLAGTGSVQSGLAHPSEASELSEAKDMVDLQGTQLRYHSEIKYISRRATTIQPRPKPSPKVLVLQHLLLAELWELQCRRIILKIPIY